MKKLKIGQSFEVVNVKSREVSMYVNAFRSDRTTLMNNNLVLCNTDAYRRSFIHTGGILEGKNWLYLNNKQYALLGKLTITKLKDTV